MTILKRYAKGFSISVLAAASLCMGAPAALAQGQPAAAAADSSVSIPDNLLGVLKLPPLATLGEKVLLISQKAELDAQTQMILLLILGQYGFPSFPGVSTSDGVTLFVLGSDAPATGEAEAPVAPSQFVAFAKVAADSPMRAVLASQNMLVQDREGWTLVAVDPAAFAAIKDFSSLTEIAAAKGHFNIELRGYAGKAVKNAILGLADSSFADQEGQSEEAAQAAKKARGWLQFAVGVLDQIDWVGYGLSVTPEAVSAGMVLAPKAGTAGATFVNTPLAGGKVKAGEFFPASAALGYVIKSDPAASLEYIKSFSEIVKTMPDERAAALVQEGLDQYLAWAAASDGKAAGVITEFNYATNKVRAESIQTGKFELGVLDAFNGYVFNKLLPDFFALIDADKAEEMNKALEAEVKTDVAKVEGQSVSVVSYATPDLENEANATAHETYYTVIKGTALSADDLDSLKALAAVYVAGKPLANNLADAYPLPANTLVRGGIDIKALAKSAAQERDENGQVVDAPWAAQLEALAIKPALFDVKAEGGHLVYELSLSLDSVVSLVKLYIANSDEDVEEVEITEVQVTPAN